MGAFFRGRFFPWALFSWALISWALFSVGAFYRALFSVGAFYRLPQNPCLVTMPGDVINFSCLMLKLERKLRHGFLLIASLLAKKTVVPSDYVFKTHGILLFAPKPCQPLRIDCFLEVHRGKTSSHLICDVI